LLDASRVVEDLKKRGVSLHLLDLGSDISGNDLSKLFQTIAAAFAEADRIRERIGHLGVGGVDLALAVSAPEFTGELVVAKLVEQLGLDAPDELAFARAAIDGVAQSAPAQRPTGLCCKDDRRRWEDGDKLDPISFMRRCRKER
jgi:hypothetical protein